MTFYEWMVKAGSQDRYKLAVKLHTKVPVLWEIAKTNSCQDPELFYKIKTSIRDIEPSVEIGGENKIREFLCRKV